MLIYLLAKPGACCALCSSLFLSQALLHFSQISAGSITWRRPTKGDPSRSPHLACSWPTLMFLTHLPQRSFQKGPLVSTALTSTAWCCIRKQRRSSLTMPSFNDVLFIWPLNKWLTQTHSKAQWEQKPCLGLHTTMSTHSWHSINICLIRWIGN